MPPRCVNVRASAQEDGSSSTHLVLDRVNAPNEGVGPLMEEIVGAFQRIVGANLTPTPANPTLINHG
ncbi:hypothetical protein J1N35_018927, partial [Gossypium stocksii]